MPHKRNHCLLHNLLNPGSPLLQLLRGTVSQLRRGTRVFADLGGRDVGREDVEVGSGGGSLLVGCVDDCLDYHFGLEEGFAEELAGDFLSVQEDLAVEQFGGFAAFDDLQGVELSAD